MSLDSDRQLRRNISRKRDSHFKLYHDEMYKSNFWRENQYMAYKSFEAEVTGLRQDYQNDHYEIADFCFKQGIRKQHKKRSAKQRLAAKQ